MDALELLRSASAAYARLPFADARLLITTRQEEDGYRSLVEQTAHALFSRPGRVRIQHNGRRGQTIVADGTHIHADSPPPAGYHVSPQRRLPGTFQPEHPSSNDIVFLFERIHENVASAAITGEANIDVDGAPRRCVIVAVTYEPGPHPTAVTIPSPLRFFLDSETSLVLRRECDMLFHSPRLPQPQATSHAIETTSLNTAVSPDPALFTYAAPPGVQPQSHPTGTISANTASGHYDRAHGFQHEQSHSWDDGDLVERSLYRFQGHNLSIERRWRILEHPKVIVITEDIQGPGEAPTAHHERTLSLPLS
ncbi:MAG: hypothetical protein ABI972_18460 [Acidobacteriota bacterium]